ncbi:hypothetical protein DFH08DRAFT_900266 [Mycena albidolilacea]|uniref:Uncharacterized protein n=1 Tax=Mycena albidolilacea TaxID=1033008 RepID=A0AAD6Z5Q4_9AGAR|nr:hypothetical protein DFH08DRAFT_900266 [Mycena albidolilacea]
MGMGIIMQAILDEHQRESAPKPKPASKKTTKKAREEEEGLDFLTSLLLFEMATKAGSTSKPAKAASSSGTKRKYKETESETNQPGTVYDAETAKKRMRGDMPMPKLEPIPQAGQESRRAVAEPVASTSKLPPVKKAKKSVPEPTAASASASKPLPLKKKSSNLPPSSTEETEPAAKPLNIQASLAGWFKPTPKVTA